MPNITTLFEGTDGVSRTLFNQKLSDVNAHGNDATMHVTAAERASWNGKVNGNNAVWTATSVAISDGDHGYTLTVPNFILTNGCQVTFKSPNDVQETQWLWVTINSGNLYAVRTVDQEILPAAAWKANSMVTLTISVTDPFYVGNGVGGRNGYAFFKDGSGSIREMFDFPLSIQTAEPTPVNTNHIWIMNDVKRTVTLDDAIRSYTGGGNDQYFAIVDSMDNNRMLYASPKSLTNGGKIDFEINHHQQDTAPWVINGWKAFAKKSGINFASQTQSKWPSIYSRIGGVIDIENAKRWDGSAWQWLSQKGHYVMDGTGIMNRTDATLTDYRAFISGSTYSACIDTTLNGNYVARCSNTTTLQIISRSGDAFSLAYTFTTSDNYQRYTVCRFSPDGQYLAAVIRRMDGVRGFGSVTIYKKGSTGVWSQLTTLNRWDIHTSVCWNEDGSRLVIMGNVYDDDDGYLAAGLAVYSRSGDTFTAVKTLTTGYGFSYKDSHGLVMQGDSILVNGNANSGSSRQVIVLITYSTGVRRQLVYASSTGYGISNVLSSKYLGNNVYAYTYNSGVSVSTFHLYNQNTGGVAQMSFDYTCGFTVSPDNNYLFIYANGYLRIYSINITTSTPTITLLNVTTINTLGNGNLACW